MAFNHDFMGFLPPDKPITSGGIPLGYTALDFWRSQFSNIWDLYDEVAEYLVSKALGIEEPSNKNGSPLWDINYRDKRIEVKSSAKYHSWQVKGYVSKNNVFGIPKTKPQDAETEDDKIPKRHNDVYVFCLSIGENQLDADPFETDHWEFYVVPTSVINRECGDNKTISIGRIKSLVKQGQKGPIKGPIRYDQLKSAIDVVLDAGN